MLRLLTILAAIAVAGGLAFGLITTSEVSAANTFTVDSVADTPDAVIDGVCADASGDCTLRAAIMEANATGALDTIEFNIGGGGAHTIHPERPFLPFTSHPVVIDGRSQPGYSGTPLIGIGGANDAFIGLVIRGNSRVSALAIYGVSTALFVNGDNNVVEGNYIGLDQFGTPDGNDEGIFVEQGDGNVIGGANATPGGACTGACNVISANSRGLMIIGDPTNNTVVTGNYIGTDPSGLIARPNGRGIEISVAPPSFGTVVGGDTPALRNVVSANTGNGIVLTSPVASLDIQGNYVGVGSDGATALGNGVGISISAYSDANVNIGGTNGLTPGACTGECNLIAFNVREGVLLRLTEQTHVSILGNSIHANGRLGIDLSPGFAGDGVTPNVAAPDSVAPNYPVLAAAAAVCGRATATGVLENAAGTYRLEIFTNAAADASGYGEGERLIGVAVIDHPGGVLNFEVQLTDVPLAGEWVTATSTSMTTGGTSEFSAAVSAVELEVTLGDLIAYLETLDDPGVNGLVAKLREAQKALDRGDLVVFENKLSDFVSQVEAMSGTSIAVDDADYLIACTQSLLN